MTLNNLGVVYQGLGQNYKALEFYGQALPILRETGNRYGESITLYGIALVRRADGRLRKAIASLGKAVELAKFAQSPHLELFKTKLAEIEAELAARK